VRFSLPFVHSGVEATHVPQEWGSRKHISLEAGDSPSELGDCRNPRLSHLIRHEARNRFSVTKNEKSLVPDDVDISTSVDPETRVLRRSSSGRKKFS